MYTLPCLKTDEGKVKSPTKTLSNTCTNLQRHKNIGTTLTSDVHHGRGVEGKGAELEMIAS